MVAINIILIIGTLIGIISFGFLLFRFQGNSYQKFLLLLFIYCLTYISFTLCLVYTENLRVYAFLYGAGSPFHYLLPISFFLLTKAIINKQTYPSRADLLWFIIPVIHAIELVPLYLLDTDQKLALLQDINQDRDLAITNKYYILPNRVHYALKLGLGLVLFGISFKKTYKFRRKGRKTTRNKELLWINTVSLYLSICFAVLLLLLALDTQYESFHEFSALIYSFSNILIFLSILILPFSNLNPLLAKKESKTSPEALEKGVGNSEVEPNFRKLLEDYFRTESEFLNHPFRLQDLADKLGISRNSLSYHINTFYNKNFNELLNEKRIEVVLENLNKPEWEKLSLQGIAEEVGFRSRTTFNTAFKKKTGCTFSEYRSASAER
jgi:AraC-like DNA-binding protein